jgi:hypothetical protein
LLRGPPGACELLQNKSAIKKNECIIAVGGKKMPKRRYFRPTDEEIVELEVLVQIGKSEKVNSPKRG